MVGCWCCISGMKECMLDIKFEWGRFGLFVKELGIVLIRFDEYCGLICNIEVGEEVNLSWECNISLFEGFEVLFGIKVFVLGIIVFWNLRWGNEGMVIEVFSMW